MRRRSWDGLRGLPNGWVERFLTTDRLIERRKETEENLQRTYDTEVRIAKVDGYYLAYPPGWG